MAVIGEARLKRLNDRELAGLLSGRLTGKKHQQQVRTATRRRGSNNVSSLTNATNKDEASKIIADNMSSSSSETNNRGGACVVDLGELSDPDDLYLDTDPLRYELRNIQSVIKVTRQNIDALNNRFAGFQHPPSIYLNEYHELTSKLHELESKQQKLNELFNSTVSATINDNNPANIFRGPRTPSKSLLRAHLPNQQRTSVQVSLNFFPHNNLLVSSFFFPNFSSE